MTGSRLVRAWIAFWIAGCAAVVGCTSGSSSSTGTVAGNGETLAAQLAKATCARHCCGAAPAPDAGAADGGTAGACAGDTGAASDGGADSGCLARAELAATEQLALLSTAYSEGLLTVNAAVAPGCVAAYQASACSAPGAALNIDEALSGSACAGLFTGYIPVGERCDMTAECVSGAYCLAQGSGQAITSLQGGGTLGVCFPYQAAGEVCNTTADCLPPLTCNLSTLTCQ